MFTATLLTNPVSRGLDPALVENLRNAWGGGDALWLAPDEAAEFASPVIPSTAGISGLTCKVTVSIW